jgi:hypothetical protein
MAERGPPSLTAVAISSLILGLLAGYFIGQGSSIGVFGGSGGPKQAKKSWPNSYDVKVHADSSDDQADDEDEADEDEADEEDGLELKDFKDSSEEVKLVLAVRTDLGMGKGRSPSSSTCFAIAKLDGHRQNRGSVLACHACMLQIPPQSRHVRTHAQAMGTWGTAKDCSPSQVGRRAGNITSTSHQSRALC